MEEYQWKVYETVSFWLKNTDKWYLSAKWSKLQTLPQILNLNSKFQKWTEF